jgi:hypothetical protein
MGLRRVKSGNLQIKLAQLGDTWKEEQCGKLGDKAEQAVCEPGSSSALFERPLSRPSRPRDLLAVCC